MKLKFLTFNLIVILSLSACASNTSIQNENTTTEQKTVNAPVQKGPTEEEIFISQIKDISINFTTTPKIANVNRDFSGAYTISVKDKDSNPISNYNIQIAYPASKNAEGIISFATQDFTTDDKGIINFAAPTPTFAADSKVYAYVTPLNESVIEETKKLGAQADYKVKSDIITKGAVLFIWDFNEKERPINNSYEILSEFRNRGMVMVGNAPINETSYIGKPLSTLHKENYEIIEDSYGYLLVGTVKFVKPVEQCDDGYLCSLIAEINAVNMKTGKTIFTSTFTNEATGKNWNACVTKCKDKLSVKIVDALVYGL